MAEVPKRDVAGPVIIWFDYGYQGWQPKSYPTLKEALAGERYGNSFVVTKLIDFDVVEK